MRPENLRKLIMAGIITALAIWLIVPRVTGRAEPAHAQAAETGQPAEADRVSPAPIPDTAPVESTELAPAPWPADPFLAVARQTADTAIGPGPAGSSPRRPVVNGIISGPTPRALIDGQVVTIGDRIADGSLVTAIEADTVSLESPQGHSFLKLPQ